MKTLAQVKAYLASSPSMAEFRMRSLGLSPQDADYARQVLESGVIVAVDSKTKEYFGVIDGSLRLEDVFPRLNSHK